jgi:hypothetical protein
MKQKLPDTPPGMKGKLWKCYGDWLEAWRVCIEELQNKRLRLLIHFALSQEPQREDPAHADSVVLALVQCWTTEAPIFVLVLSKAA